MAASMLVSVVFIQDETVLSWVLFVTVLGSLQAAASFWAARKAPLPAVLTYSLLATLAAMTAVLLATVILVIAVFSLFQADVQVDRFPQFAGAGLWYAMIAILFVPALWAAWRFAAPRSELAA